MKLLKRMICIWRGHDYTDPLNWGQFHCCECGHETDYHHMIEQWGGLRSRLRARWKRFREWWKCEDCGGRCGHHDLNKDHVPF